jgi:hypothetical protein
LQSLAKGIFDIDSQNQPERAIVEASSTAREMTMHFNEFGFQEVEYQKLYRQFAAPFLVEGNAENNLFFIHEAQRNHIYGVNNALLELIGDALTLLSRIAFTAEASHFLRFGVMRRLRMIDSSFKSFQSIVPPNRTVPLSPEQSDRVCRDLNAIYIDLLGLLDNYAWVAVHQLGSTATKAANPLSIGLFKRTFAVDPVLKPVADALQPFSDWERDVKTRRNPAAHRMPLYVPPAALTPVDVVEFERFEALISQALRVQEFEKMDALREGRRRVGTLIPKFLHDPGEPAIDIYPTVPEDIGQAVKIGRATQTFLLQTGAAAAQPQ